MKRTKKTSLYKRFLGVFILSVLAVAFTIGGYMFINMYKLSVNNIYQTMDILIEQTNQNLTQYFKLLSNVSTSLAASDSLDKWIERNDYFSEQNPNYYINVQAVHKEFENILSYNSVWALNLFDYAILCVNDKPINYTYTTAKSIKELKDISDYISSKRHEEDERFLEYIPPNQEVSIIFYNRKMKSKFKSAEELNIIMAIEEKNISRRFDAMASVEGSKIFLVDDEGVIFSSNDKTLLGTNLTHNKEKNYDKYTIKEAHIKETDFSLIYLIPKDYALKTALLSLKIFIYIFIILIIVTVIVATMFAVHIGSFLKEFSYAMNCVKNKDYTVRMEKYNDIAIDNMGDSFNEMVSQIETLIHTTYESKLLLKDMQIKFMQHQMNPHFLFNMLMTIEIDAKLSGNEKLYTMINQLSGLLRAGIYSEKRAFVTLREELDYVEQYLSLQKIRFEDRFEYTIRIDEHLKECIIPRLSIEPIVENAMIHGIEQIAQKGEVYITIRDKEEAIQIEVKDNGNGFDVSKIFNEQSKEFYSEIRGRESVGIRNTDKRIKLIYGKEYGLTIESEKKVGTTISMLIPKERERDV